MILFTFIIHVHILIIVCYALTLSLCLGTFLQRVQVVCVCGHGYAGQIGEEETRSRHHIQEIPELDLYSLISPSVNQYCTLVMLCGANVDF
jgi:hypothetical protein